VSKWRNKRSSVRKYVNERRSEEHMNAERRQGIMKRLCIGPPPTFLPISQPTMQQSIDIDSNGRSPPFRPTYIRTHSFIHLLTHARSLTEQGPHKNSESSLCLFDSQHVRQRETEETSWEEARRFFHFGTPGCMEKERFPSFILSSLPLVLFDFTSRPSGVFLLQQPSFLRLPLSQLQRGGRGMRLS